MEDRVNSIKLTDNDTCTTYELDFSRDSVRFAEARKFEVDEVVKYPATKVPELFYYSFRMHHRKMAKSQTDALLEKMGGVTKELLERLVTLYNQAALSNTIAIDDDVAKNDRVTVEL